jgi:hypothetical protein
MLTRGARNGAPLCAHESQHKRGDLDHSEAQRLYRTERAKRVGRLLETTPHDWDASQRMAILWAESADGLCGSAGDGTYRVRGREPEDEADNR